MLAAHLAALEWLVAQLIKDLLPEREAERQAQAPHTRAETRGSRIAMARYQHLLVSSKALDPTWLSARSPKIW